MRTSREQRPIDVTTLPPSQEGAPSSPPELRTRRMATVLGSIWAWICAPVTRLTDTILPVVGSWLRRPITMIALTVLLSVLVVEMVIARSRPSTIEGPALSITGWSATAYLHSSPKSRHTPVPGAAIDGDLKTRWTTQRGQRNSDWFAVDMGKQQKFHQIVMDAGTYVNDYPRAYAVYASSDGVHWGRSLVSSEGQGPVTVVNFVPQTARYVKVVQTGQDPHSPWSICEMTVH